MNKDLIIWDDAQEVGAGNSTEVGKAFEVFEGFKYFVVCKNNGKKATIIFKDVANNKVRNVIMQSGVDEAYRAGKLSFAQALSLPVVRMEKLMNVVRNPDGTVKSETLITDKPTFWLGKPNQGWKDVVKEAVEIVEDWEKLAV